MNLMELFIPVSIRDEGVQKSIAKLKSGVGTVAKIGAAAFGVAATGLVAIGKASVSAYGEYQQLVGGIETLFKDSAGIMQQYANEAYKTAGMSANYYMENVTSFAAAMLQSVGGDTEKAAQLSDMAMKDISDNANKMGTNMESLVQTYQSLSRGNFAMLDNLKLGKVTAIAQYKPRENGGTLMLSA